MSGRWYSDTSQIAWACHQLVQGEETSHACEFKAVEGWRLASVVHRLIKNFDWPILHRDGEKNIRYYFLAPDTNIKLLKKPKSYIAYLEKNELLKEYHE